MPEATYQDIDLDDLLFDPDNPRFPASLDGSDSDQILTFMLDDAGLVDLMRSIAAQGFFPGEPILVCESPSNSEKWTVVEGNRRLAASKLLANPSAAPTKRRAVSAVADTIEGELPSRLPCLIFGDRSSILKHLGFRHVTGIKEWDPLAKARFLKQRYDLLDGSAPNRFRELARTIGSRSDYVGRLLTALAIYNHAEESGLFDSPGLSEEDIRFSLITSALAYSEVVEYLGLDSAQDAEPDALNAQNVTDLMRWMFERDNNGRTRLGESRNLRRLADVLNVEEGLKALQDGYSIDHAESVAGGGGDAYRTYMETAEQSLLSANGELDSFDPIESDVTQADEVRKLALHLKRALSNRLDEES